MGRDAYVSMFEYLGLTGAMRVFVEIRILW